MEVQSKKKNVIKHKAPPTIRQTRTSAYRILKSNPLMMYDKDSVKKMGFEDTRTIPKSVDVLGISSSIYNSTQTASICTDTNNFQTCVTNNPCKKEVGKPKNKPLNNYLLGTKKIQNVINSQNKDIPDKKINNLKSNKNPVTNTRRTATSAKVPVRQSLSTMHRERINHIKRRSKSAEKFNPKKCIKRSEFEEAASIIETVRSMENIPDNILLESNISPIKENPKIVFKTPIAYNRRSIVQCTPSTGRNSIFRSFSSTPAPIDLQKRLNNWLTKRGKSLGSFHHLKCFGLHDTQSDISNETLKNDEEDKENKVINNDTNIEINANSKTDTTNIKNASLKDTNFELIARDGLDDLHKLIQDGYPLDQCEGWLGRIRHHYQSLEDEPLYWECRAALEQCRGNISSAVEHYRKAIVKGAEVHTIEDSLEQLLQKFSLLNINPELSEKDTRNKKIILDARNAFKSTIIQFAVQERMLKKKEEEAKKEIIVTPVRRSTRLSVMHSAHSSIKLCTSIKEISMDENTKFHGNSYLSIRFNS